VVDAAAPVALRKSVCGRPQSDVKLLTLISLTSGGGSQVRRSPSRPAAPGATSCARTTR
jgi:hypothetical protein